MPRVVRLWSSRAGVAEHGRKHLDALGRGIASTEQLKDVAAQTLVAHMVRKDAFLRIGRDALRGIRLNKHATA